MESNSKRYTESQLRKVSMAFFRQMGYSEQNSNAATDVLLAAELRGIHSHGLNRIPEYVALWQSGRLNVAARAELLHQSPSTALIDGQKGLGLIIAQQAMDYAIKLAEQAGSAWVAVRNSFHFGIAGYHASRALQKDMIGFAMTNANPLVAPTFSRKPMLGTNPIAMVVPAGDEQPFFADFATAPVARGKLDTWQSEGKEAPYATVQNEHGMPATDPAVLRKKGAIRTLGGTREQGNHKGYCMSAMVDILSAVLPGANFGPLVVPTLSFIADDTAGEDKGIGHFFGAMRIDAFRPASAFKKDMDLWLKTFRNAEAAVGQQKVFVPGDPEREKEKEYRTNGIPVNQRLIKKLDQTAVEAGFDLPVF